MAGTRQLGRSRLRNWLAATGGLLVLAPALGVAWYRSNTLDRLPPERAARFAATELAHRGGYHYGPENCLSTVESLAARGVRGMEVDLLSTRDGELVLFHDPEVSRVTDGRGEVHDMTLAEMRALRYVDARSRKPTDCGVSTLDEYLALVSELGLYGELDLKESDPDRFPGVARRLSELLTEHDAHDEVYVSAFDPRMLRAVRQRDPEIVTAYSFKSNATGNPIVDAMLLSELVPRFLGVSILEPQSTLVTDATVRSWTADGYVIVAWTANTEADKSRLRSLGVSFVTNCPGAYCENGVSDEME